MHVAHWGSRTWRRNLDETVLDSEHPQAFPARRPADLMGRIRVRLCAEGGNLVAYGFGGQRIAIPASSVGAVRTVDAYRIGRRNRGRALLVFDHEDRILLRARGLWEVYGEVARVCRAAGLPAPTHVSYFNLTSSARSATRSRARRKQKPPRYRSGGWATLATVGMVLLVPALIGWGPGVGIATLVHGFSDASLVAELRGHGVSTPGFVIDVPQYSTDDNGNTTVTDVPTLAFLVGKQVWQTPDPAIGGRPLPLDPANPAGTRDLVTVVYLAADPDTAAAERQIAGSVWHGAPTGNLVSAALLTLALPFLLWRLVRRISRRRRGLRDADLLLDMDTGGSR
jgi:hypothetical protein